MDNKVFIGVAVAGAVIVAASGGYAYLNSTASQPTKVNQEVLYDNNGDDSDYMYGDYEANEASTESAEINEVEEEPEDKEPTAWQDDNLLAKFEPYTGYGIAKTGTKIYSKADKLSDTIRELEYGESCSVESETDENGLVKIVADDIEEGYVKAEDITDTEPEYTVMYCTNKDGLDIHTQADRDSETAGHLEYGDSAKVWFSVDGGWLHISTDDIKEGYVFDAYMSEEEPDDEPETMEDLLGSHTGPWGKASDFITAVTNPVTSDITGLTIDKSVYNQKTLAVIYPTDEEDQPSYGIGNAEVLYEYETAGNKSEFMAIIQDWSKLPVIGTQAEVKHYMIYNANEWDSLVIHNGSNSQAQSVFDEMKLMDLSQTQDKTYAGRASAGSDYFYKSTTGKTVITADRINQACASLSYPTKNQALQMYWHSEFGNETLGEYETNWNATSVDLSSIFKDSHSAFKYDSSTGTYKKYVNDDAQYDALTGDQLEFTNIIIQYVEYGTMNDGDLFANVIESKDTQGGYYITKGKAIPITWNKGNNAEPTKYYDVNGNEITLNTGKTYIGMARIGTKIKLN